MPLCMTLLRLVHFGLETLWFLKLAEEGSPKDCFIFLRIVPMFTWPLQAQMGEWCSWVKNSPDFNWSEC